MMEINSYINRLNEDGFTVIDNMYSPAEVENILQMINEADTSKETFRKPSGLFAIRQFLKEVPGTAGIIFSDKIKLLLKSLFGNRFFVVKSIYFDKPPSSNWYVSYHQDLTISVDRKSEIEGFGPWTVKQNQFAVQPPLNVLQNIITLRIHLDDTDENNGALKVIPGSHTKGICRPETIDLATEKEVSCNVLKGGVMLMKTLLLHSSGRTIDDRQRRVIHIEFSNEELPVALNWAERLHLD